MDFSPSSRVDEVAGASNDPHLKARLWATVSLFSENKFTGDKLAEEAARLQVRRQVWAVAGDLWGGVTQVLLHCAVGNNPVWLFVCVSNPPLPSSHIKPQKP